MDRSVAQPVSQAACTRLIGYCVLAEADARIVCDIPVLCCRDVTVYWLMIEFLYTYAADWLLQDMFVEAPDSPISL